MQCVEQELRTLMSAFLDITEDADMEDSDVESMLDPDASDGIAGERSFRYGPTGRPIGGDSWLGMLIYQTYISLCKSMFILKSVCLFCMQLKQRNNCCSMTSVWHMSFLWWLVLAWNW